MNANHGWLCPLDEQRRNAAKSIAQSVGARLSNTKVLAAAIAASTEQCEYFSWGLNEFTGLALFYGYLDSIFPGSGFDGIAHKQLLSALGPQSEMMHSGVSLYGGLSGLGLAAHTLSRNGARYQRLLASIDTTVNEQALASATRLRSQTGGLRFAEYDVLYGLSGVAAYLLSRVEQTEQQTLNAILETLTFLATDQNGLLSGTPKSLLIGPFAENPAYEHGLVNCGLAHGIPGPLAVLSLAHSQGWKERNIDHAISTIADWLLFNSSQDQWGIDWPAAVALDGDGNCLPSMHSARAGWCYGSPGVARSLWLAGVATNCTSYQDQAVAAMESVIKRRSASLKPGSITFCHGIAGLLQIVLRFYDCTGSEVFRNSARLLFDELIGFHDQTSILGFRERGSHGQLVDNPRLIDGVAGVVLALLAATHNTEPSWDRIFMLS